MCSARTSLGIRFLAAAGFAVVCRTSPAQCTLDWLPGEGIPGLPTQVNALATFDDGNGPSIFIGGSFTVAGDVHANHIARWDGSTWHAVGSGLDGDVYCLFVHNGELIAGGSFTHAGEIQVNCIAKWDGTYWHPLGGGMTSGNVWVSALTSHNGLLYAGGNFLMAGGAPASDVAYWDGRNWHPLGSGIADPGNVSALTIYDEHLVAAGDFNTAGGVAASMIAQWDLELELWKPLGSGLGPNQSTNHVGALAVLGSELVAGGDFSQAGGVNVQNVARWDGSAWSAMGSVGPKIQALTIHQGELVAGGSFGILGLSKIARWDGVSWQPMSQDINGTVYAFTEFNGQLVIGGNFTLVDGAAAFRIARRDGDSWVRIGQGMNGSVNALAVYQDDLVAAGTFKLAGNTPAVRIAAWNGTDWSAFGGGLYYASGVVATVRALAVHDGELYAGGDFDTAEGVPVEFVARWNGKSWSDLDGGLICTYCNPLNDLPDEPWCSALLSYNDDLIVGGFFELVNGTYSNCIASWDGEQWSSLGSGMGPTPQEAYLQHARVFALTEHQGDLIAGGWFSTAGGVPVSNIARWDGEQWHPLGGGVGEGWVYALTVHEGELIAGGSFEIADGQPANHVARWDGSQWHPMGDGIGDSFEGVYALQVVEGDLIAAGALSGGTFVKEWNGQSWEPLGDGVFGQPTAPGPQSVVNALTVYNSTLVAGGVFLQAGEHVSAYVARWGCATPAADLTGDGLIDPADLAELLAQWGSCGPRDCSADIAPTGGDGVVGPADLAELLANWS